MPKKAGNKRPQPHGGTLVDGGPGRPKGSRNWSTILREIGDSLAPEEVRAKLKELGKKGTTREAAAVIAYRRALRMDAVGNRAFEAIADREDGKAAQPITGEDGGPIQVTVTLGGNRRS